MTINADTSLVMKIIDKAKPGDTILLKDGTYKGYFNFDCKGTKEKPITIKTEPGASVVFDAPDENSATQQAIITARGEYINFVGFEVKNSFAQRRATSKGSSPSDIPIVGGIEAFGRGNKFINLVIHDHTGNGIGLWKTAFDS